MAQKHAPAAPDTVDETAKALLLRIQAHIPLSARPFQSLAADLGLSEAETLERTRALIDARLVRQVGPIFDGRRLGYQSSLVAARYDAADLASAAALISSHPGVSHNYQRDHAFNLWYTIAVPPGRAIEDEAGLLHRLSGAQSTRLLPAVRMFKLAVRLDMNETAADARSSDAGESEIGDVAPAPTEREIAAIRALQEPFPVVARPFDEAATRHGFASAEDLVEVGEALHSRGAMRRFSGVLRHREAGFSANGMVAWKATPGECATAGHAMAAFAKVSHCYQRPTYDDWPYPLFTMIHGRSPEEVLECVAAIREVTSLSDYQILYSTTEFKKERVRYFTDEWDAWRRALTTGASGKTGIPPVPWI